MNSSEAGDTCPKCGKKKLRDMGKFMQGEGWLECPNCGYIEV